MLVYFIVGVLLLMRLCILSVYIKCRLDECLYRYWKVFVYCMIGLFVLNYCVFRWRLIALWYASFTSL